MIETGNMETAIVMEEEVVSDKDMYVEQEEGLLEGPPPGFEKPLAWIGLEREQ